MPREDGGSRGNERRNQYERERKKKKNCELGETSDFNLSTELHSFRPSF